MDRQTALNRVIELAFKWQEKHEWTAAFKAADRFREYRDKGTERFDKLSEERHSQVIAAHSEFIVMENLLRQHAPQFLELVPRVCFFVDAATDHSHQIRDLRKLEGELLLSLSKKPEWTPTETEIQKVKDALVGMKFKTTNLEAIRTAAKMNKQRVSIILKLIGHTAK